MHATACLGDVAQHTTPAPHFCACRRGAAVAAGNANSCSSQLMCYTNINCHHPEPIAFRPNAK